MVHSVSPGVGGVNGIVFFSKKKGKRWRLVEMSYRDGLDIRAG